MAAKKNLPDRVVGVTLKVGMTVLCLWLAKEAILNTPDALAVHWANAYVAAGLLILSVITMWWPKKK